MNQEQKELIINSVKELGLADTLTIFGGNKDIIRKAYIDNPERYMDYLIGDILKEHKPITDEICFYNTTNALNERITKVAHVRPVHNKFYFLSKVRA